MTQLTAEQEEARRARLPQWAQQRIEVLERNVAYWRGKAENGPEKSNTFLHGYTDDGSNGGKPLGADVDVRFDLPDEDYILAHLERGMLQIHLGSRWDRGISVRPTSTNTVRIGATS